MATETKLSYEDFTNKLEQFYGTEQYHRIGLTPIVATDGVKYFAETCSCFWLLDDITINLFKKHQELGCLFIDIEVNKRHTVHITVREDSGEPVIYDKKIKDVCEYIPVGNYKFYLMNNVLLLPSEY